MLPVLKLNEPIFTVIAKRERIILKPLKLHVCLKMKGYGFISFNKLSLKRF